MCWIPGSHLVCGRFPHWAGRRKHQTANIFIPPAVLETGYDILFFWVARMIMAGLEFTGKIPFHTVYLHGLIRDENGQKMSKTKGNVIDPLVVMDQMGTDALRFTLLVGSSPGKDMNLSIQRVEANRNFANKMWNAGRYIIGAIQKAPSQPVAEAEWTLADSWIWARLQNLIREVERLFTAYQYGEAGRQIYDFFWGEFADWYLEISKVQIAEGGDRAYYTAHTLVSVMDLSLRMLHPFTPFVTEELWSHLKKASLAHSENFSPKGGWEDALIIAHWPLPRPAEDWEAQKVTDFMLVQEIIRAIRNLRIEKDVKPGIAIPATIVAGDRYAIVKNQEQSIAALAQIEKDQFEIVESINQKPQNQITLVVSGIEIYLPLEGLVDIEADKLRLEKELAVVANQIERLEKLLDGEFAQKAPSNVVEKERQKLATYRETADKIKISIICL